MRAMYCNYRGTYLHKISACYKLIYYNFIYFFYDLIKLKLKLYKDPYVVVTFSFFFCVEAMLFL